MTISYLAASFNHIFSMDHWEKRVSPKKSIHRIRKTFNLLNHGTRLFQLPKSHDNTIHRAYLSLKNEERQQHQRAMPHIHITIIHMTKNAETKKLLPVTRHWESGSIGLEPSLSLRPKKSRMEGYSSKGKATSSKSAHKQPNMLHDHLFRKINTLAIHYQQFRCLEFHHECRLNKDKQMKQSRIA